MTHDVTDFRTQVLERSHQTPVLVDFWAAWCGPCRVIGPVLERLAAEAAGRWELAKVDTEAMPDVAARYDIMSIPAIKLFVNGEVVDEFMGALPESEVRRWLDQAIPSPLAAEVAGAAARIEAGDFEAAAAELRSVVDQEPANQEARLLLARALIHVDPARVPEALPPLESAVEHADRIDAIRVLARIAGLPETPAALPEVPTRERFLAGARALRAGDFAAAFEAFIEVLRADRDFADGAAKEAGRAMIVLLGHEHPVCERYFRSFSSAVHA